MKHSTVSAQSTPAFVACVQSLLGYSSLVQSSAGPRAVCASGLVLRLPPLDNAVAESLANLDRAFAATKKTPRGSVSAAAQKAKCPSDLLLTKRF